MYIPSYVPPRVGRPKNMAVAPLTQQRRVSINIHKARNRGLIKGQGCFKKGSVGGRREKIGRKF